MQRGLRPAHLPTSLHLGRGTGLSSASLLAPPWSAVTGQADAPASRKQATVVSWASGSGPVHVGDKSSCGAPPPVPSTTRPDVLGSAQLLPPRRLSLASPAWLSHPHQLTETSQHPEGGTHPIRKRGGLREAERPSRFAQLVGGERFPARVRPLPWALLLTLTEPDRHPWPHQLSLRLPKPRSTAPREHVSPLLCCARTGAEDTAQGRRGRG